MHFSLESYLFSKPLLLSSLLLHYHRKFKIGGLRFVNTQASEPNSLHLITSKARLLKPKSVFMCFPTIEGSIEVEERRPRYPNEPRRKRLKFVKDRTTRLSDEWALVRPSTSERFHQHEIREPSQWPQQHQQPPQFHGGQHPHLNGAQQLPSPPMAHQGYLDHWPQPNNNYGNGVQRLEEFRPGHHTHPQEIEPRYHNDERHYHEIEPRYPESAPRSQLPPHLQTRGISRRGRPRTRSRSRGPPGQYRDHSVHSDDTIDESSRGSYRSRRRHSRRPPSPLAADSYDSIDAPPRQHRRSRSGRRGYV